MKHWRTLIAVTIVALFAVSASAAVMVGGTETFTATTGGADWDVGGPDGWQIISLPAGNNSDNAHFGSTGTILTLAGYAPYQYQDTQGQPDPGSYSGDPGTLAMQHMANWDDGGDYTAASMQMAYITFDSVAGVNYELSAMVNTVMIKNPADGNWDLDYPAGDKFGGHPRSVGGMASLFANIQIGLKHGIMVDPGDLTMDYTQVTGLIDNLDSSLNSPADAWVQTSMVSAVGDGGPMTILLKFGAPDISAGALSDLDVRWDNVTLTPEPSSLALVVLGGLVGLIRRYR